MLSPLVLESQKVICAFVVFVFKVMFSLANLAFAYTSHNKQFKQIRNAWQFWFAVGLVFTAQCGGFCSALLTT
ncbi:hypothetical protein ACX02_23330 [Vibrio parahaemolyticus]|nr:hypothetical protein ACX02_23330 [Vibrio parahaemolyticus]